MEIVTIVSTDKKAAAQSLLNSLLADLMVLYVKVLNYHWNVGGPSFAELHEMFGDFYGELQGINDKLAERILSISGTPLSTMREFLASTSLCEGFAENSWDNMVADLKSDCVSVSDKCQAIFNSCSELGDDGSADLMLEIQAEMDKKAWMFSAFLKG